MVNDGLTRRFGWLKVAMTFFMGDLKGVRPAQAFLRAAIDVVLGLFI